jgi:hypothetical protein
MTLAIAVLVVFAAYVAAVIWFGYLLGEVRSAGTAPETVLRARTFFAICNLGWALGFVLLAIDFVATYLGGAESTGSLMLDNIARAVMATVILVQIVGSALFVRPLLRAHRLSRVRTQASS